MAQMNGPRYRVGVVGCGRKGTEYARAYNLNPATRVVAAADNDPENLALFCKRFGVPGYASYEEMLLKEKVEIASTVLPVSANPDVVVGCARLGVKAITAEKPISATLADADRMVAECRKYRVKLSCGDLERSHSEYWKAKALIDSGELGDVQTINFMHGCGVEMSGGGCQTFSLIRLFADDSDVTWVTGWVAEDPASDYDQGVAGYIRFHNEIEAFMHRRTAGRSGFEVLCSRGVIFSDGSHVRAWKAGREATRPAWSDLKKVEGIFSETTVLDEGFGIVDAEGWENPGMRQKNTIQSMIDALDRDIEPRSNGDNGRKVLEIAIALRESHRRGMTPVQLPLQDRSLRILPKASRMYNKKEVYGREKYAKEIARFTRGQKG